MVVIPLAEPAHFTTYVLHKHQRLGLAEPVQRFAYPCQHFDVTVT